MGSSHNTSSSYNAAPIIDNITNFTESPTNNDTTPALSPSSDAGLPGIISNDSHHYHHHLGGHGPHHHLNSPPMCTPDPTCQDSTDSDNFASGSLDSFSGTSEDSYGTVRNYVTPRSARNLSERREDSPVTQVLKNTHVVRPEQKTTSMTLKTKPGPLNSVNTPTTVQSVHRSESQNTTEVPTNNVPSQPPQSTTNKLYKTPASPKYNKDENAKQIKKRKSLSRWWDTILVKVFKCKRSNKATPASATAPRYVDGNALSRT
ncbi:hypothetical protein BDQ17DRAFT_1344703 [Cyathus striatus]|nr:hypothetical protein BDQ17DRAFT_1344703 [Cyathus striatus]